MSIVSHLAERADPRYTIDFLYSVRDTGDGHINSSDVLFLDRLASIFSSGKVKGSLKLFPTPGSGKAVGGHDANIMGLDLPVKRRRITIEDVVAAIGEDKRFAVIYVCGVPIMTDDFVQQLTSQDGLGIERHRVLYEKWW